MKKYFSLLLCILVLSVSVYTVKARTAAKVVQNTSWVVIEAVLPTMQNVVVSCLEIFPPPAVQNSFILNTDGRKRVIKDDAALGDAKDDPHLFVAIMTTNSKENSGISTKAKGLLKEDDAFNTSNAFTNVNQSNTLTYTVKKEVQLE